MVFNMKNNLFRRGLTIVLGLCIALARIVYPTSVNITKGTVIIEFLLELLICSIIILINFKEIKELLKRNVENKKNFFKDILTVFALMFFGRIVLMIIIQTIYSFISNVPLSQAYDPASEIGNAFMNTFILPVLLVQCFIAPIEEEIVFRYTFREVFSKKGIINTILYVVISSWLFGFIHSASLFSLGMINYICMGIVLSLCYLKYKNIRLLIYGHITYNTFLWIVNIILMLVKR